MNNDKNLNLIKFCGFLKEIHKNLCHLLTDRFQTLMGNSGHQNGHLDIEYSPV